MVPDRWETVWHTLVCFGIFLVSYTDDGLMRELHREKFGTRGDSI